MGTTPISHIAIPQWSAVLYLESERFSLIGLSGTGNYYRIRNGQLELRVIGPAYNDTRWHRVPPEALRQHLELRTPVATWLSERGNALLLQ